MSDSVRPHRRQPTRLPRPWDSPGKNTGVGCHFLLQYMKVKSESEVAQLCPTLSGPMDCSLPGSSVHGIFQARVLEWGAIAFSVTACWFLINLALLKSQGREARWAAVSGVAQSRTRLSDFIFTFHFHALEKEMATHSSALAWRIPGMGKPSGLLSMGSHRVGHD